MASFSINVFLLTSLCTIFLSNGEELTSNNSPSTIECKNASTTCIINCMAPNSCYQSQLHCHLTASQACIINLFGGLSGQEATVYTHRSPLIFINGTGNQTGKTMTIFGHEQMGTKLYINGANYGEKDDFEFTTIFSPVGEGSLLSMKCNCEDVVIYDDWTTEIYQQPIGHMAFRGLIVQNIFDTTNAANVSRSDNNYIGLNRAYRAPVMLNSDDCAYPNDEKKGPRPWRQMNWNGHNHGHWFIYSWVYDSFVGSIINATADIPPYGTITEYDIILLSTQSDTNIFALTLFTDQLNQNGPNIYAETNSWYGLTKTKIYAKHANTVTVYCHNGGDCHYLMVQCPENNLTDSCKIYCDSTIDPQYYNNLVLDDPGPNDSPPDTERDTTQCYNMNIYTTNGYCKDASVICIGNGTCVFDTDANGTNNSNNSVKIYCGYQHNTDYCTLNNDGTLTNFGNENCSNGYGSETECDAIVADPISKISNYTHQCDVFPQDIMSLIESLTQDSDTPTIIPTHIPTISPTFTPSELTQSPSVLPTKDQNGQVTEYIYLTTKFADGKGGNEDLWFEKYLIFLIIGSSVLLCLVLVCIFGYISLRKSKNSKENVGNMELVHVTNDTDTNTKIIKKDSVVPQKTIYSDDSTLRMWLNNLGLMEYYSLFVEQGFDANVSMLYELKDENLKEIGIKKMADRLLIIRELKSHKINAQAVEIQGNAESDGEIENLYKICDVPDGTENNTEGNIVTVGNGRVDSYDNGNQMTKNVNSEEEWEYFEDDGKKDNSSGSENMYNNSDSDKMHTTTGNI